MIALDRAIELAEGQGKLAEAIGVRTSAISYWKACGELPFKRAAAIHRFLNGRVTICDLCPDIAQLVLECTSSTQLDLFSTAFES